MATPQLVKNSNDGSRPGYNGILDWAVKNWKDIAKVGGAAAKSYIDYKDQKRRNEVEQAAYNEYLKQVEAAGQEAQAAVDLNLMPMAITNVPTTKADVSDFTAVAARGGLMNLPTKQRKRYAYGPNPEDIPTMDELTPFNPKEEGVVIGEQVFYDTGKGDRSNAMQIWGQMQDPDKAVFDFDFEIFFMDGAWRDMIKSEIEGGGDTRTASAVDPEDALNDMSMNIFNKALHELTDQERQMLIDMANDQAAAPSANGIMQAAKGGRIKKDNGGIMNLGGLEKDYRTTGGFVPIGAYEKKDDVPARLSKNEFVMTADAVRAAGGGSINRGAQRMYNTMKHLEASPTAKRMTA